MISTKKIYLENTNFLNKPFISSRHKKSDIKELNLYFCHEYSFLGKLKGDIAYMNIFCQSNY